MAKIFWKQLKYPILALAPMAGVTDSAFRQICKKYGADVTYSEMASATALFYKPRKTLELARFKKTERPYIVQLFGKDPAHFAKAAKIITEKIKPDGIDINFGCPAKKVFRHGSGCALMPQKKLAREIILAVCRNTHLPVSLKIRAGLCLSQSPALEISAVDFIKNIKDLNFQTVIVHCRTYEQGFSGPPDYSIAEKIKKIIPDKIVLANGGIYTPEDAVKILKDYPLLDGLGIARGAWGKPWIFEEIKEKLCHCEGAARLRQSQINTVKPKIASLCRATFAMTNKKIKRIMLEHAELIYKDKGKLGLFEIRKHMSWYVKGFPGAAELRRKLVLAESLKKIKKILA